jgi:hypothetical protein
MILRTGSLRAHGRRRHIGTMPSGGPVCCAARMSLAGPHVDPAMEQLDEIGGHLDIQHCLRAQWRQSPDLEVFPQIMGADISRIDVAHVVRTDARRRTADNHIVKVSGIWDESCE